MNTLSTFIISTSTSDCRFGSRSLVELVGIMELLLRSRREFDLRQNKYGSSFEEDRAVVDEHCGEMITADGVGFLPDEATAAPYQVVEFSEENHEDYSENSAHLAQPACRQPFGSQALDPVFDSGTFHALDPDIQALDPSTFNFDLGLI
ncbi:nuclear export mediator factor Nemf [Dorcoceras hygrometricum]|uniref:Nuclear export mediator factor Nemf n=1 Tax=Dorcoceras hygrometricum TaxID=472368 RepID=A0A2Z7A4A9_9LAMI|nr:nuclear export mediator factor Nemf [Dorcoceras hygrometricum]